MSRGALWWDFDGTLVSRPAMWAEVALRLLGRHTADHGVAIGTMTEEVSSGMPWHRPDLAHPELRSPELWWAAVYHRYVSIFSALGYPSAAEPAALARLRDDILDASAYVVFDDVRPVLERAKEAGWRNLIVSNHIPELETLVRDLGLTPFFESIVSSGVVGYEKPHRRLFEEAARLTGSAGTVWMIGDNCDADCRPVRAMGHNAVLVRSPTAGVFDREAHDLHGAFAQIEGELTEGTEPTD